MEARYYIGTGDKNGFYTLRLLRRTWVGGEDGHFEMADSYIQNLSTNWDTAVAKVVARTLKNGVPLMSLEPFELSPFGRNMAKWQFTLDMTDPYKIPFGKYQGRDMRDVAKEDPEYLYWMMGTLCAKRIEDSRKYHLIVTRVALVLLVGEAAAEHDAKIAREKEQRRLEREAAKRPVPVGRVMVRGKVIKLRSVETDWGGCTKMTVVCDGFALYGTCPGSLGVDVGDEVEFSANIQASPDDQSFGFFSRPTKARNLSVN